jgi:hypothetical protein
MKRAIVGAGMSAGPSEPPGRKNHDIFFGLRNLSSEQPPFIALTTDNAPLIPA